MAGTEELLHELLAEMRESLEGGLLKTQKKVLHSVVDHITVGCNKAQLYYQIPNTVLSVTGGTLAFPKDSTFLPLLQPLEFTS